MRAKELIRVLLHAYISYFNLDLLNSIMDIRSRAPLSQGVTLAGSSACLIWRSFYTWRNPEGICVFDWNQTSGLSLPKRMHKPLQYGCTFGMNVLKCWDVCAGFVLLEFRALAIYMKTSSVQDILWIWIKKHPLCEIGYRLFISSVLLLLHFVVQQS